MEAMQQSGSRVDYVEPENDEERRIGVLMALGSTLAGKRRDAVAAKSSNGIEMLWLADEEFYQGYDDANRHEFAFVTTKPSNNGGTNTEDKLPVRGSTVFPNITQPFVDAAAARVGDMLLPTDDRNFAIEATPIPDMFEGLDALMGKSKGLPATPQPAAAPMPQQAVPQSAQVGLPNVPGSPMPVQAQPQEPAEPEPQVRMPDGVVMALSQAKAKFDAMVTEAKRKAKKAQDYVDDWLEECQYHAELRKVIDDSAKLGSGVIKGPFPVKRVSRQWRHNIQSGVYEFITVEEIKPASRRVDPWDLFPDPSCGESIHNGSYVFERDRLTRKKLEELIGTPEYLDDQIIACLREGPARQQESDNRNLLSNAFAANDQFEIWYFYGNVTVAELMAAGCDCDDMPMEKSFPAIITMVNNRPIKAALNPLDDGQFPYDVIPWKRRPGMPWGMGVARQMRTPQRIVVAATRNMMDNAGLASGPLITLRRGVEPEDGVMEVVPLKFFVESDDATGNPAAGAPLTATVIPMLEKELMAIVQFGMKMAEDVTGLPSLLQGQQGTAPETVGGMTILNNNANSVLRRIARLFDASITEPHIRRYYTWLMEYGNDDDAKGDYQIVARGSSALVERDIQGQELTQIMSVSLNPAYGLDPKKTAEEYLRSRRFDPKNFQYSKEDLEKMQSQPPPEDPRVTAAKIMADASLKRDQQKQGADQASMQAKQNFEAQESERDRAFQKAMAELTAELDQREQAGKENMSFADIKAMLAATTMKLQLQKELSYQATSTDLHKHANPSPQVVTPPSEPAGRAPAGEAYQA
jgi:hypothetical protein